MVFCLQFYLSAYVRVRYVPFINVIIDKIKIVDFIFTLNV